MSSFSLKCNIDQGGSSLRIGNLQVHSHYDGHLTFRGAVPISAGNELKLEDIERSLGAAVTLTICEHGDTAEEVSLSSEGRAKSAQISGFIDQLTVEKNTVGQQLLVSGYSPTIFLDCAPGFQAFGNKTLYEIAEHLLGEGHCPYRIATKARNYRFDWSMQCQESPYNFLKRLCSQTGELECFYDGEQLVLDDLTNPAEYTPILLKEGNNLTNLTVSFDTFPQTFKVEVFDYRKDQILKATQKNVQSRSKLINAVLKASKAYPERRIFSLFSMADQAAVNSVSHRMSAGQSNEIVVISGCSTEAALRVGVQIKIESTLLGGELRQQLFTVISVSHHYQEPGVYSNSFTAIPSSLPFNLPMSHDKPSAGPLCAVVKEVEGDPEKLGRVRIALVGDPNQSISPWLRLLQPFTGEGGWYLPPKVGDHVMILGEQFNPECSPVVLGSFYTGSRDAGFWEGKQGLRSKDFACYTKSGKLYLRFEAMDTEVDKSWKLTTNQVDFVKK